MGGTGVFSSHHATSWRRCTPEMGACGATPAHFGQQEPDCFYPCPQPFLMLCLVFMYADKQPLCRSSAGVGLWHALCPEPCAYSPHASCLFRSLASPAKPLHIMFVDCWPEQSHSSSPCFQTAPVYASIIDLALLLNDMFA